MGAASSPNDNRVVFDPSNDSSVCIMPLRNLDKHEMLFGQIDGKDVIQLVVIPEVFGKLFGADFTLHFFKIVHLDIIGSLNRRPGRRPRRQTIIMDVANMPATVTQVHKEILSLFRLTSQTVLAFNVIFLLLSDLSHLNCPTIVFAVLVLN
jgi:hypothetical protein